MQPGVNIPWQDKHSGLLPGLYWSYVEPCQRPGLHRRLSTLSCRGIWRIKGTWHRVVIMQNCMFTFMVIPHKVYRASLRSDTSASSHKRLIRVINSVLLTPLNHRASYFLPLLFVLTPPGRNPLSETSHVSCFIPVGPVPNRSFLLQWKHCIYR